MYPNSAVADQIITIVKYEAYHPGIFLCCCAENMAGLSGRLICNVAGFALCLPVSGVITG